MFNFIINSFSPLTDCCYLPVGRKWGEVWCFLLQLVNFQLKQHWPSYKFELPATDEPHWLQFIHCSDKIRQWCTRVVRCQGESFVASCSLSCSHWCQTDKMQSDLDNGDRKAELNLRHVSYLPSSAIEHSSCGHSGSLTQCTYHHTLHVCFADESTVE